MAGELEGNVAVITGGSRGIGRAIATRLAGDGADCLLAARSKEYLKRAAAEIAEASGRRVEYFAADLRDLGGCDALAETARRAFGGVDILVNCAGATLSGPFLELEDAAWDDGFALKFFAAVRLSRSLWPALKERHGTVINIIGGAARTPDSNFAIGGAVNAAMANFSKALAGQGLRDDVNVNAIHPGSTRTERLVGMVAAQAELAGITPEAAERARIEGEGVRRFGEPEDVANLAAFLCSPAARHIHGAAVAVDGGATKGLY
jgi:3-oxoacyl-[acyl-carrier protein] reductase